MLGPFDELSYTEIKRTSGLAMSTKTTQHVKSASGAVAKALADTLRTIRTKGPSEIQFWFIALMIGIGGGLIAMGFRLGIESLQSFVYQTNQVARLHRSAAMLDWYWIVLIPVCGGLIVGLILDRFTPDGRVRAVADVIEGAALREGRVEKREGLASAAASFVTLATGGSSGREGPVVHLVGVLATYVSGLIKADGVTGRDLLGCAVAAGVSASFNAPIAGALFALEVVLRHFAMRAFAPIVIASVAGTVVSRMVHGDVTEYFLPTTTALRFYVELPAFILLGLLSGVLAIVLMRSIFWADTIGTAVQTKLRIPRALRPAIAGGLLGVIALWFPHIIGVGYGITSDALSGRLLFWQAVVFAAVKVVAVAITMGGRMGGGVFSPALVVGSLAGLAFGMVATGLLPDYSGTAALYALAGMGAVAAAVLGAPISTTLIVFELTGDWQTGLAVMVAVSMSTAVSSRFIAGSFFLTQLERRGVRIAAGPQAYLLSTFDVATVMRSMDHPRGALLEDCEALIQRGIYVAHDATLDRAMPLFENSGESFVPVVRQKKDAPAEVRGALFHVDALRAFNRALAAVSAEEHA